MPPIANKTIEISDPHVALVAKELKQFWYNLIYKEIIAIIHKHLPVKVKLSTSSDLLTKIQSGSIVYDGEYFYGAFNARVSKELRDMGGKWDAKKKAFKLKDITPDIKSAVSSSKESVGIGTGKSG